MFFFFIPVFNFFFFDRENRVFKSSPHARQLKNSAVMTPPPIHGKGNREVRSLPTASLSVQSEDNEQVSQCETCSLSMGILL